MDGREPAQKSFSMFSQSAREREAAEYYTLKQRTSQAKLFHAREREAAC